MKLNQILQQDMETLQEFFDRSYGCENIVIVFRSKKDKDERNDNCEVWSRDKANGYISTLFDDPEQIPKNHNQQEANQKPIKSELTKITTDTEVRWIDSITGEIVHKFEQKSEDCCFKEEN